MRPYLRGLTALFATVLFIAGCDSNGSDDAEPLEATLVRDLPADVAVPSTGGPPATTGRYTLFSLRENRIVLASTNTNRTDSATTAWDIGFRSTNIIVNGGTSGPGQGAAVVVADVFEDVLEAPADAAFRVDGQAECPTAQGPGPRRAICPASDHEQGWYHYTGQTGNPANAIFPIAGRTIVVRTADGRFAKLRILSYYQGNPDPSTVDAVTTPSRYFTFEYVFQPDGSRSLRTEE